MPSDSIFSLKRAVLLPFVQQTPSLTYNIIGAYHSEESVVSCNVNGKQVVGRGACAPTVPTPTYAGISAATSWICTTIGYLCQGN